MSDNSETLDTVVETQPKPTITLQDIASVVEILQICTARGVWKATELSVVGGLYDRLTGFLEGAGAQFDKTRVNSAAE